VGAPVRGKHCGERLCVARGHEKFIAFHHGHLQDENGKQKSRKPPARTAPAFSELN